MRVEFFRLTPKEWYSRFSCRTPTDLDHREFTLTIAHESALNAEAPLGVEDEALSLSMLDAEQIARTIREVDLERRAADEAIKTVLHDNLYEGGITAASAPRTSRGFLTPSGIRNSVITSYVEHAFIAWLLVTKHKMSRLLTITDEAVCRNVGDPEDFFPPSEPYVEDYISDPEGASVEDIIRWVEDLRMYLDESAQRRERARLLCSECVFSLTCLTVSVIYEENHGTWGGMADEQRRLIVTRFQTMRRNYTNGKMKARLRADLEAQAQQIADKIRAEARRKRQAERIDEVPA